MNSLIGQFNKYRYYLVRRIDNVIYSFFYRFIIEKQKPIHSDVIILDDFFPNQLSDFRYLEFNSFIEHFNAIAFTTGKSLPLLKQFKPINYYISQYKYSKNVRRFYPDRKVVAKIAILVFASNVSFFLDYLEKNKIKFIFTLYPGGKFRLNNDECYNDLKRVFESPYFCKVIVTQKITNDYLLSNFPFLKDKIEFIYGCPMTMPAITARTIKESISKNTFDICFVAGKYSEKGLDKGYDVFVDVAKKLSGLSDEFRFNVVGGFDESVIDVRELGDRIKFYGYLPIEVLNNFYKSQDVIISANRSNILAVGAFDGFPTASVVLAGLASVVMFISDDNKQNLFLKDGADCFIIGHDSTDVFNKVLDLYNDREKLTKIANQGSNTLLNLFSHENQIVRRMDIVKQCL